MSTISNESITPKNITNVSTEGERNDHGVCHFCQVCKHPLEFGVHIVRDIDDQICFRRVRGRKCKLSNCNCEITLAEFEYSANTPEHVKEMVMEQDKRRYLGE